MGSVMGGSRPCCSGCRSTGYLCAAGTWCCTVGQAGCASDCNLATSRLDSEPAPPPPPPSSRNTYTWHMLSPYHTPSCEEFTPSKDSSSFKHSNSRIATQTGQTSSAMGSKSQLLRDSTKRVLANQNELQRRAFLYVARNTSLPASVRHRAQLGLNAFDDGRGRMGLVKNRCVETGRGRGIMSGFGLCRVRPSL